MGTTLTPAKVLLLAVHLASYDDVPGLGQLASQHPATLHNHVLLRILLTHLPETVKPAKYVTLLQEIATGVLDPRPELQLDSSPVSAMSDQLASKKANKLHLAQLQCADALAQDLDDPVSLFLFQRAHKMDAETGMLALLPDLLEPFVNHSPVLRIWIASTVLPFVRRNVEYYAETLPSHTLAQFQQLRSPDAVRYLLARNGGSQGPQGHLTRDLRGLISPWLYDDARWTETDSQIGVAVNAQQTSFSFSCPGWEQALEWLVSHSIKSWKRTADVVEQWGGPADVYLGPGVSLELPKPKQRYLEQSYARALMASSYMIQEATADALGSSYRICKKTRLLLGYGQGGPSLHDALASLPSTSLFVIPNLGGVRAATHMRNGMLEPRNPLTSPSDATTGLLMTLILSAFVFTRLGVPCTVKRAGDLAFLEDEREQRGEVAKLFHAISSNAQPVDDESWIRARREILWLHDWGQTAHESNSSAVRAPLAVVPKHHIEGEFLKILLVKSRFALARRLFDGAAERLLAADVIQQVVFNSALNAFDNASNPNRTRGGLKQCDEIIHALPLTASNDLPGSKRIQALLKATHALSDYRLILKQGEPFSPVVLRVHSDPISIIDEVLHQNPKAYTRLQEFVEMGINMVSAGLLSCDRSDPTQGESNGDRDTRIFIAERRVIAMCVEAALREDDFETAYSYIVSRLGTAYSGEDKGHHDVWSWQAALRAGQHLRTIRSQQPTHLGTASWNPEVRHLEQRMECLATALRIAPTCQLQDILKSFRRCEEQLDSAIKEEAANEAAWDAKADQAKIPGTFNAPLQVPTYPPRNLTASAAARQADDPMSLFDLSRATARIAQRNLTGLSSLQGTTTRGPSASAEHTEPENVRVRKRDQLREAATGTLVSGVGWLIGANATQSHTETSS